ncbi:MAG TPA: hypothetical protein DC000_03940 [Clostridiales bacterium]|nr:hypothetical protein [Clostridiales bacterium]
MDINDKQEKMNNECSSDKLRVESNTTLPDDGSAIADLLHVFGVAFFRRKKGHKTDGFLDTPVHHAAQTTTDHPVSSHDFLDNSRLSNDREGFLESNSECDEPMEGESYAIPGNPPVINEIDIPKMDIAKLKRSNRSVKFILFGIAVMSLMVGFIYFKPYLFEPDPPGEDVVASYNRKYITKEELNNFIALEQLKESDHTFSLEDYQAMVTMLAVEQMIQDWASEKGIIQREDVQHGLKDLLGDANVSKLIDQIHEEKLTPESIPKWEVQQYYDKNRDDYSDKMFSEVEDEIRNILVAQKDEEFFPQFIEELKKSSGLEVNFDLLEVNEPTDEEISGYYLQNATTYQVPQKAEMLEIKIVSENVQETAEEASRKLRSGESFESIAKTYGEDGKAVKRTLEKRTGDTMLENTVWKMSLEEVSDPITAADGSVSIIKLVGISSANKKPLSEVKDEITEILRKKNMELEYTLRKDEALFSVHSKRYTLGDFYTEFNELPSEYQAMYSTYENKKQLVEQLITKELLLEETGDSSSDQNEQHSLDELKINYLYQILHQEEVDGKLTEPTETEIRQFYDKYKKEMITPASVKISFIWIDQGLNKEKSEQALKKATEALSLLDSGTNFSEVAKNYSEDGTSETGGELDEWFYQGFLPPELEEEVFALTVGQTSGIIDGGDGLYIIKVREKIDQKQKTYEESVEEIKNHLKEEKHNQIENELEKTLLDNANFTIYNKTLRKILNE